MHLSHLLSVASFSLSTVHCFGTSILGILFYSLSGGVLKSSAGRDIWITRKASEKTEDAM